VKEIVVETNAQILVETIQAISRRRHLCLEEGPLSEWLFEELEPHVDEIQVIQAEPNKGNKSDARDARWLADAMRVHAPVRSVFKTSTMLRPLREAARLHRVAIQDRTRAKNRLNALLRSRGVHPDSDLYAPETREAWIVKLPRDFQIRARALGRALDAAHEISTEAEAWLEAEAEKCDAVKLLMTVPGIGIVRAAHLVAIVMRPQRFRTTRQFWAYCGLAVVTHSSAEWKKTGRELVRRGHVQTRGLNTNRNPILKSIFKSAAMTVLQRMPKHTLAQNHRRMIEAGKSSAIALVTLARRIAAATLAVWKKKEKYDPSKQISVSAA
jgi:transposase